MQNTNNELSLKDLFVLVGEQIAFLKTKWTTLLLVGFIGGVLGGVYAKFIAVPTYTGNLSFVLSNDSKASGLGALAGNFGIELGNSSEGAFAGENIIQLLRSRKMIERAIVKTIPNSKQTLLDAVVEEKFSKKWRKKDYLNGQWPLPNDVNRFTPVQDSLFSVVHAYLVEKCLVVSRLDKKLSFYRVIATSPNEAVAKFLPKYLVDEASQFYIETKTKQARKNLDMLQQEADSLRGALGGNVTYVANRTDELFNLNPSVQRERVSQQTSQIQVQVLGTAYGEVIKNLEIAKITLQKETPLYQLIDVPDRKLKKDKASALVFAVAMAIMATLLGCFYFLIKRNFNV